MLKKGKSTPGKLAARIGRDAKAACTSGGSGSDLTWLEYATRGKA